MTFGKHDSIDDDVITALRADARGPVPPGSRERMLRRLGLGAGMLGATATVATGAGTLVASTLSAHSTAVLVSTLAIGIGIGFGAREGVDVIAPKPPAAAMATRAAVPAPAPAPPPTAARAPTPTPLILATPPTAPEPPPPSNVARDAGPRVARPPTESAVPAPVLTPPGLAAQQSLLDDARSSLVRGDGTSALSAIGAHRLRFPDTALGEERAALEIRSLVALGRLEEARERHAAFERAFPGSLFAPSLRTLMPAPTTDFVTESPAPSQE
jgi:resuscitation-promoting factor RpfA